MNDDMEHCPRVVVHKIPQIEVYQVAEYELARIQDACGKPRLDLTLCISTASTAIGLLPSVFNPGRSLVLPSLAGLLILCAVCFGYRAWRSYTNSQSTIDSIRLRKVDPQ